ncbi:phage tail sheath family protein [bacterium 210820-DFI.6.37]|nr:phage tail sheath family protein [bacterium 210820-DFI.6.37]
MTYKHGTYGEFAESISTIPVKSKGNAVYIGTAPVHLVRGWKEKDLVNMPVSVTQGHERSALGYSDDWESFSLCEVMNLHFENSVQPVGPIVAINVLDPDKHKATDPVTVDLTFINNYARIQSDRIILDTLVLADMVEEVDYTVEYDFTTNTAVIYKKNEEIENSVRASYDEIDPSMVELQDIIGNITNEGTYSGIDSVSLVYQELGLITNILAAPGYSQSKEVYKKLLKVSQKLNGHWDCVVVADIPVEDIDTKEKAIQWKEENAYISERSKVCWPKWKTADGRIYHLSAITAWLMTVVDAAHDGIPMETPSNKQIPSGKQYFGKNSKNRGYDQQAANELNEKGITTAIYWGGDNVLWGPHTAAYIYGKVTDKRAIFDNSIRMMMYVSNSFQEEHALEIDKPMTKAMADTIKAREQEKLDALVSIGALIGEPIIVFEEKDNSLDELMEGNFVWRQKGTPTPPFKSGTLMVAYTDEGYSVYYGGDEE